MEMGGVADYLNVTRQHPPSAQAGPGHQCGILGNGNGHRGRLRGKLLRARPCSAWEGDSGTKPRPFPPALPHTPVSQAAGEGAKGVGSAAAPRDPSPALIE